jgi:hypothetical protein
MQEEKKMKNLKEQRRSNNNIGLEKLKTLKIRRNKHIYIIYKI